MIRYVFLCIRNMKLAQVQNLTTKSIHLKIRDFRWTNHHPVTKHNHFQVLLRQCQQNCTPGGGLFAGIRNNSGQLNCGVLEFQMNLIIFGDSNLLETSTKNDHSHNLAI